MKYSIKYKIATAALAASLLVGGVGQFHSPETYVAEAASSVQQAEVTWGVNLRKSPSTSGTKIRMIAKGEQITITGQASNGWYKVTDSRGNSGYISNSSKYTKIVNGTSSNTDSNASVNTGTVSNSNVEKVISVGMKYWGTPYEYGSNRNTTTTFDCSDFVKHAFKEALGITLPGDSRKQGAYVKDLGNDVWSIDQLKRGDLMFFMSYKGSKASDYKGINKSTARITHVGIYLGNGEILHTYSKESGGVKTNKIEGTHWEHRFLFGGSALK